MGPPPGSGSVSNTFITNANEKLSSHAKSKPFTNFPGDDRRNCALCNSSLGEEAVVAMNRLWHPDHFLCNGCKKPIRQTFQVNTLVLHFVYVKRYKNKAVVLILLCFIFVFILDS